MNDARVVLVTGASSGIGKAIAQGLARRGYKVYGTSRTSHGPDEGGVRMVRLDVTRPESVSECVSNVLAREGRIDLLVNNAGGGLAGTVADTPLEEARALMETNFWGAVRMAREVLPAMLQRGDGRIINIGSLAGHVGLPFQAFYSASKFAIDGLTEALRLELRGTGVQATLICPGDFSTGFTTSRRVALSAPTRSMMKRLERTLEIYERDEQAGGTPEPVAALVTALAARRRLRVRYHVGRADQRLGVFMKRLMPAQAFERLMAAIYRL